MKNGKIIKLKHRKHRQ